MAKHTTEYVRQVFKEYHKTVLPGYVYKGSGDKVPYTCDKCGFKHSILLRNLKKGGYGEGYKTGCKNCIKHREINYPSTLEEIKRDFELENYEITNVEGDVRKNCYIYYICQEGHGAKVRKDYWYRGHRCITCEKLKKDPSKDVRLFNFKGKNSITMCDIKEIAHDYGFRLLSKGKYDGDSINALNFECIKNGHRIKLSVNDLRNKKKCSECEREDLFEKIRKDFEDNNYTLLTNLEKEYENNATWLECIHNKCGHKFKTSWVRFGYHKNRCPECARKIQSKKKSGTNHFNWKNYSKEDIEKSYNYRANVSQLTEQNYKKYKNIINPLNLYRRRGGYSLDHIYSVMEGFRNNVLPEVISNPNNLQMLREDINIAKSDKSDMSLEELYYGYNNWSKKLKNE